MNKLFRCLLFIITVTSLPIKISIAQGYMPMTTTMKTPYGNVPYTQFVPVGMPYYYNQGSISLKYAFHVVLNDGKETIIKSKVHLKDTVHSLRYNDRGEKKRLLPNETKEIYRITSSGRKIARIPTDSCWLFNVVEGKINGYSFVSAESAEYLFLRRVSRFGDSALRRESFKTDEHPMQFL